MRISPLKSISFRLYSNTTRIFDPNLVYLHRNSITRLPNNDHVGYLYKEVAERIFDRFLDIKRDFYNVLEIGPSHSGYLLSHMDHEKVSRYTITDISSQMLDQAASYGHVDKQIDLKCKLFDSSSLIQDGSALSIFPTNTFDSVLSNLYLHWINDLPSILAHIERILLPDGVFIASVLGGDTLYELRSSFQLAELERRGGISQRVSPMIHLSDLGPMLSQANFHLLTVDYDDIIVNYPTPIHLVDDLNRMGTNQSMYSSSNTIPKDILLAMNAIYSSMYGNDNNIPATFQVLYMIGWKKSSKTPESLERGSAKSSLKTTLI